MILDTLHFGDDSKKRADIAGALTGLGGIVRHMDCDLHGSRLGVCLAENQKDFYLKFLGDRNLQERSLYACLLRAIKTS